MIELVPTIIIGLGGSGKFCCRQLKKLIKERVSSDHIDNNTGLPPFLDIFCIETNRGQERDEDPDLPEIDILNVSVDKATLRSMQTKTYLQEHPEVAEWLYHPLPLERIENAAEQIRQAGRLAFFYHRAANANVQDNINGRINRLTNNAQEQANRYNVTILNMTPRVFIISSLCGGTGSGMLLDIAGLVKTAAPNAIVTLIAFLPEMFKSVINATQSIYMMGANTYASLKEINYYKLGDKENWWQVVYRTYPEGEFEGARIKEKLFDYCYLIDKTNSLGVNLEDRRTTARMTTEFLFAIIAGYAGCIERILENNERDIVGENWVLSFGLSKIYFPQKEIYDLLVNHGIQHTIDGVLNPRAKNDVENVFGDLIKNEYNWNNWGLYAKTFRIPSPKEIIKKGNPGTVLKRRKEGLYQEFIRDKERLARNAKNKTNELINAIDREISMYFENKGLEYTTDLFYRITTELKSAIKLITSKKNTLDTEIKQLNEKNNKYIGEIETSYKNRSLLKRLKELFGWTRGLETNVDLALTDIGNIMWKEMEREKVVSVGIILKEITEHIDSKINSLNSLKSYLTEILVSIKDKEPELRGKIIRQLPFEIKLRNKPEDIEFFRSQYITSTFDSVIVSVRRQIRNCTVDSISEILKKEVSNSLQRSGFSNITLRSAMTDQENELSSALRRAITDISQPYIQHNSMTAKFKHLLFSHIEERERISDEISRTLRGPQIENRPIQYGGSSNEIVVVTCMYDFRIRDIPSITEDYAEKYQNRLDAKCLWMHINKAAVFYPELSAKIESKEIFELIEICRDLKIIFKKHAEWYTYRSEEGKDIDIAQGKDKVIQKLENDSNLRKKLQNMVKSKLQAMAYENILNFWKDHDRTQFASGKEYVDNHKAKYKDDRTGNPIECHNLPSFAEEIIQDRIKRIASKTSSVLAKQKK